MVELPSGCQCSRLQVHPGNWKTDPRAMRESWYIKYRFYDPAYTSPKQIVIKEGINQVFPWPERVQFVEDLLIKEWNRLKGGYNPFMSAEQIQQGVTLLDALETARLNVQIAHNTRTDMKSMLKYVGEAAARLKWLKLSAMHTTVKHVRELLKECYRNERFTDNTYNHYRKYLRILFNYLVYEEVVTYNPITSIQVKKVEMDFRTTLTKAERTTIDTQLHKQFYTFWRFIQIFFRSGARRSELLLVKRPHVNLHKQTFKVKIRKGQRVRIEEKVIMDNVLELWKEIMNEAGPNDYLFGEGLVPGPKPIRPEQVTRRWFKHVKKKLGINADMYSLKHLLTDMIDEQLGIEAAAEHDSHTSTAVTKKHYAVNHKTRQRKAIRSLKIDL